jgi:C-terminal, D2-small domain, of ClpB protein
MSQYQSLFGYSGVEIRFTSSAIDEICHKASERGGGARGLRGIMVCLAMPISDYSMLMCFASAGGVAPGANVRSTVSGCLLLSREPFLVTHLH